MGNTRFKEVVGVYEEHLNVAPHLGGIELHKRGVATVTVVSAVNKLMSQRSSFLDDGFLIN